MGLSTPNITVSCDFCFKCETIEVKNIDPRSIDNQVCASYLWHQVEVHDGHYPYTTNKKMKAIACDTCYSSFFPDKDHDEEETPNA